MADPTSLPIIYPTISFPDATLITGWVVMVIMIFFVLVRLSSKIIKNKRVKGEDCLIGIGMLCSIAQSIATTLQIEHGPGGPKAFSNIQFQRAAYIAELFYIPTMAIAKTSVLWLLYQITPDLIHMRITRILIFLTALWAFSAEFVAAFQCRSPGFEQIFSTSCINQTIFWTYYGACSIVLDLSIMLMPVLILHSSKMSLKKKITVIWAFGNRICLIISTIARLVYLHRISHNMLYEHSLFALILCTQVEQNLSIITSTVPYLKPFFKSLESGMMRNDDAGRILKNSKDRSERYTLHKRLLKSKNTSRKTNQLDGSSCTNLRQDVFVGDISPVKVEVGIHQESIIESKSNNASGNQIVIQSMIDWTVDYS